MTDLAKYDTARKALAEAVRIDEVKEIHDKATALAAYARLAKDGQLIAWSTEIRKRSERRLGEVMEEEKNADGRARKGRPKKVSKKPILANQHIDKNLADRARKAAAMPEEAFEKQVEKSVNAAVAAAESPAAVVKEARRERQAEKRKRREEREQELAARIRALPEKKYGVIYADPPWRLKPWSRETGLDRAADNHYPTAETEEIRSLGVADIAHRSCVLFLWATVPMLVDALDVMSAWGFSYKAHRMWVKDKDGAGYWFSNRHELLLVGTTGTIPAPAPGDQWSSVLEAPRGRHSEKPEEMAGMIEALFPNIPKIELYRRGPARDGWDAWGSESEDVADGSPAS